MTDWVKSIEVARAAKISASHLHTTSVESRALCKRAHAGLLTARAARYCTDDNCVDAAEVPAAFWWAEGHNTLEQNWQLGDFETYLNQCFRLRAFGVEWRRDQLEALGIQFEAAGSEKNPHLSSMVLTDQPLIHASQPLPKASHDEVRGWLRAQVAGGATQTQVDRAFREAVPGKRVTQSRDQVREWYDLEYRAHTGLSLKSGPRSA